MNKIDTILQKIDSKDVEYGDPIEDIVINQLEDKLQLRLPDSYKYFLSQYGWLEVMGTEYLGYYGENMEDSATFIGYTLEQRKKGLLDGLVIVQNDEDFGLVCLDTSKFKHNECQIVIWDRWNKKVIEKTSLNFAEYFEKDIVNMLKFFEKE